MPTKPDPRFLNITAHDLRGAVGVLDGALKELTREVPKDNADAAKLTAMMGRSTQRLLLIGDRLSSLAKLLDDNELELQEVDLLALVKEAAERAFGAHARRSLRLRIEGSTTSLAVHAQTLAAAVAELTALFCGFSQAELVVSVSREVDAARIRFQSDHTGDSVQRTLRDRQSTTQANAGINFAEAVLGRHRGSLELIDGDGAAAGLCFVLPRQL